MTGFSNWVNLPKENSNGGVNERVMGFYDYFADVMDTVDETENPDTAKAKKAEDIFEELIFNDARAETPVTYSELAQILLMIFAIIEVNDKE